MKKNIISGQMKKISYCAIALYVFCIVSTKAYSQDILKENIQANIHVDQIGSPIHPFTYGMFTELLHNMFENGIWAEMLSDRKFSMLLTIRRLWNHVILADINYAGVL